MCATPSWAMRRAASPPSSLKTGSAEEVRHTPGRRVIPAKEMALKIEVAAEARKSEDFLIIARTDARTSLGLDEAIERGKLYRKAGADIVFIESPRAKRK